MIQIIFSVTNIAPTAAVDTHNLLKAVLPHRGNDANHIFRYQHFVPTGPLINIIR